MVTPVSYSPAPSTHDASLEEITTSLLISPDNSTLPVNDFSFFKNLPPEIHKMIVEQHVKSLSCLGKARQLQLLRHVNKKFYDAAGKLLPEEIRQAKAELLTEYFHSTTPLTKEDWKKIESITLHDSLVDFAFQSSNLNLNNLRKILVTLLNNPHLKHFNLEINYTDYHWSYSREFDLHIADLMTALDKKHPALQIKMHVKNVVLGDMQIHGMTMLHFTHEIEDICETIKLKSVVDVHLKDFGSSNNENAEDFIWAEKILSALQMKQSLVSLKIDSMELDIDDEYMSLGEHFEEIVRNNPSLQILQLYFFPATAFQFQYIASAFPLAKQLTTLDINGNIFLIDEKDGKEDNERLRDLFSSIFSIPTIQSLKLKDILTEGVLSTELILQGLSNNPSIISIEVNECSLLKRNGLLLELPHEEAKSLTDGLKKLKFKPIDNEDNSLVLQHSSWRKF
jgi:hypothetical protein